MCGFFYLSFYLRTYLTIRQKWRVVLSTWRCKLTWRLLPGITDLRAPPETITKKNKIIIIVIVPDGRKTVPRVRLVCAPRLYRVAAPEWNNDVQQSYILFTSNYKNTNRAPVIIVASRVFAEYNPIATPFFCLFLRRDLCREKMSHTVRPYEYDRVRCVTRFVIS